MVERRRSETAGGAAANAASRPKAESGWGLPTFSNKSFDFINRIFNIFILLLYIIN